MGAQSKAWFSFALTLLVPAAAAASGGDAHGHGEFGFKAIVASSEFWAACLNFGLLVFLLRKFGRVPISEFLASRRSEIESAIAEASAMKDKAQARYDEYTERLKTLDDELAKLKADISRAAEEDKKRIVAEAEDSARRLKQETETLIDQHAQALSTSVRREVVEAAVKAAEEVLIKAVRPADQQRLADDFKSHLGQLGGRP
ncbi:MAG: ATP synthase F0 subunit B [Myxococcales bacterium]|nr:ATP synthase F0 subunit B [Myxococcales bacterium]